MYELGPDAPVFTLDSDFRVYRRNKRQSLPLICPWTPSEFIHRNRRRMARPVVRPAPRRPPAPARLPRQWTTQLREALHQLDL